MEYDVNGTLWYGSKDPDDSDYCGRGCYWRVDGDTLIIGGNGCVVEVPYKIRNSFKKAIIEYGIKSIMGEFDVFEYTDSNMLTITDVGGEAFYGCESLETVVIPNSVTYIGYDAFCECNSLTSVIIPDSVTEIGEFAFSWCGSLTTVVIPSSVTVIGAGAFYFCESLRNIDIPDSVTEIGEGAFKCCRSLTDLVIPNGVTEIKSETFGYCYSLTNVVIPESVKTIGESAFLDCSSLTNVVIPESVTTIGKSAFNECNIEKLFISNNIKEIGSCAFGGGGVDEIVFDGTEEEWERINQDGWDDAVRDLTEIGYHSYILRKTKTGCIICWEPCSLASMHEDVWLSADRKILVKSFYKVSSYTVPDGVIKIRKEAFKFCESLETIVIPGSLKKIGSSAFENCNSLKKVIFKGTKEQWEQIRIYEDNAPLLDAEIEFSPQGGLESGI